MLLKPLALFSSDKLTVVKKNKILAAEASDLFGFNLFRPIYDDAADVGFTVVSARTGDLVTFYHDHDVRDDEGELMFGVFKPIEEHVRKFPQIRGWSVHIFND